MRIIKKSVFINAPIDRVFSYESNSRNQLDCLLSTEEFRDTGNESEYQHFDQPEKISKHLTKTRVRLMECTQNNSIVFKIIGNILSIWTWAFVPVASGTRLNLMIKQLSWLSKKRQAERDADLAIIGIKKGIESKSLV